MTDEEYTSFGDRFPSRFNKIKILGRGGFAMVWLGEDIVTKVQYAIKQISTMNMHKTHLKEIWFCDQFFDAGGVPKPTYKSSKGIKNFVRLVGHEFSSTDTWLFYELSGDSLGSHLYDLISDGTTFEGDQIYKVDFKDLYKQMQRDPRILKELFSHLAEALQVLSLARVVHSDLKTENILLRLLTTSAVSTASSSTQQITKPFSTSSNQNNSRVSHAAASVPVLGLDEVKLIDYGSAFSFENLKNFSMATPEYMAPEILNYILYSNKKPESDPQLVQYLKDDYKKYPHAIDVWSLGCVLLEIINGIPLWMSLRTRVVSARDGREYIKTGLFSVTDRVFHKIIKKQIATIDNIDEILLEQNYSRIPLDSSLITALKGMLQINPAKRITPEQIIRILNE